MQLESLWTDFDWIFYIFSVRHFRCPSEFVVFVWAWKIASVSLGVQNDTDDCAVVASKFCVLWHTGAANHQVLCIEHLECWKHHTLLLCRLNPLHSSIGNVPHAQALVHIFTRIIRLLRRRYGLFTIWFLS